MAARASVVRELQRRADAGDARAREALETVNVRAPSANQDQDVQRFKERTAPPPSPARRQRILEQLRVRADAGDPAAVRALRPRGYNEVAAGAQRFAHGLTIGASDEIMGTGAHLRRTAEGVLRGEDLGEAFNEGREAGEEVANRSRADMEQFGRERPIVGAGLEIAGALAPAVVTMGAGAAPAAAGSARSVAAARAALRASRTAPGPITRAARSFGRSVAGGALWSLPYSFNTGRTAEERFDPGRAAIGAAEGAAGGAILHGVGSAFGGALNIGRGLLARMGLKPQQRADRLIEGAIRDDLEPVAPGEEVQEFSRRGARLRGPVRDEDGRTLRGDDGRPVPSGPTAEQNFELAGRRVRGQASALANVAGPGQEIARRAQVARGSGRVREDELMGTRAQSQAADQELGVNTERAGTRQGRVLDAMGRAADPKQTRAPGSFEDFRRTTEDMQRNQARENYPRAYREENIRPEARGAFFEEMIAPENGPDPLRTAVRMSADDLAETRGRLRQAQLDPNAKPEEIARLQEAFDMASKSQRSLEEMSRIYDDLNAHRNNRDATPEERAEWARLVAERLQNLSARDIDMYQRGLRDLEMYGARRGFTELMRAETPKTHDAMTHYGRGQRARERIDEGRNLVLHPNNTGRQVPDTKSWPIEERDALMQGMFEGLDAMLARGEGAAVAAFMRRADLRRLMEAGLGRRGFLTLRNRMMREAMMRESENYNLGGSPTQPRQEDVRAATEGENELGFLNEAIRSRQLTAPIWGGIARLVERMTMLGIRDRRVNDAMARRLFATATEKGVRDLVQGINSLPSWARIQSEGQRFGGRLGGRIGGALGRGLNRPTEELGQDIEAETEAMLTPEQERDLAGGMIIPPSEGQQRWPGDPAPVVAEFSLPGEDGRETKIWVLVPMLDPQGTPYDSEEAAISAADESGAHLGVFSSREAAETFAQREPR